MSACPMVFSHGDVPPQVITTYLDSQATHPKQRKRDITHRLLRQPSSMLALAPNATVREGPKFRDRELNPGVLRDRQKY